MAGMTIDRLRGFGVDVNPFASEGEPALLLYLDRVPEGFCLDIRVEEPVMVDGKPCFPGSECDRRYYAVRDVWGYMLISTGRVRGDWKTRRLSTRATRDLFSGEPAYVVDVMEEESGDSMLGGGFDTPIRCF